MDDPAVRPLLPRRLSRGQLIGLDAVAALAYLLIVLVGPVLAATDVPAWLRWVVVVGVTAPVTVRRLWPGAAFGAVLVISAVALWLGALRDPLLAAAYALYPLALREPRHRREPTVVIGLVSLLALVGVSVVGVAPSDDADSPTAMDAQATPAYGGTAQAVGLAVLGCALLGGVWTVGRAVRERRAYAAHAAAQSTSRAVAEERLRIARELHDIVSHTLSVIGVKAAIANHVADRRPQEARDALRIIEATSRDAITEMRNMLGVLRADQPTDHAATEPSAASPLGPHASPLGPPASTLGPLTPADLHPPPGPRPSPDRHPSPASPDLRMSPDRRPLPASPDRRVSPDRRPLPASPDLRMSPDRRPSPGLADLPDLVDRAAMAGVRIDLSVCDVSGLSRGVELSLYRIVQESLTNVVRHAAPTSCQVKVDGSGTAVRISVTDAGPGRFTQPDAADQHTPSAQPDAPARQGHGLIGMRERALMHGGTFTAGSRRSGGFQILATLPRSTDGASS